MKEFLIIQRVKAKPMTRKEYNDLRGWIIPEDENPNDEGFLVESEGKPNHPAYEGYLQWLTKEQFESRCVDDENEYKPITFNEPAPGDIKVGDYVFASHWQDCDPNDPWNVGKVTEAGADFVVVGDVSQRRWRRATRISPEKGKEIIEWFQHRK
ncbi:MAG: hypothetical protein ACMV0I_03700 [Pseudomonas sp.]